jgi:hypothetical protein
VTLDQQIACVERELRYRRRVYPRVVQNEAMTQEEADHQIAAMEAVLKTLKSLQQGELFHGLQ